MSAVTAWIWTPIQPRVTWPRPNFSETGIMTFLLDPHAKMPNMNLTRFEAGDIAAYVSKRAPNDPYTTRSTAGGFHVPSSSEGGFAFGQ